MKIMAEDEEMNKMLSKVEENKLKKEKRLYEAAYELFTTKGINDTAINDIVKMAGVAKGTFYLYFKDKYCIVELIVLRKSSKILREAIEATLMKNYENPIEGAIAFVDYLIEYLRNDKKLLKLIYKNLSWGMYRKAVVETGQYEEMRHTVRLFMENFIDASTDEDEAEKNLFIIIELVGSVCYSSIILQEPDNIDNMKPVLYKAIKKILSK